MNRGKDFLSIIVGLTLLMAPIFAADPNYVSIESKDGRTIEVEIVTITEDVVEVRRADGKTFKIPLSQLTPATVQRIRPSWRNLIEEFCQLSADEYMSTSKTALAAFKALNSQATRTTTTPLFKESKSSTTIADIVKVYGKPTGTEPGNPGAIYFWGPLFFVAPDENSKPTEMGIDWTILEREKP